MSKIFFKVELEDSECTLYSGVLTNFGGFAWNFVRKGTYKELYDFAIKSGWVSYLEG